MLSTFWLGYVHVAGGLSAVSARYSSMILYPFLPWSVFTRHGSPATNFYVGALHAMSDSLSASAAGAPAKLGFHSSINLSRRNVVTSRFQALRQLLATPEHAHRLAAENFLLRVNPTFRQAVYHAMVGI